MQFLTILNFFYDSSKNGSIPLFDMSNQASKSFELPYNKGLSFSIHEF